MIFNLLFLQRNQKEGGGCSTTTSIDFGMERQGGAQQSYHFILNELRNHKARMNELRNHKARSLFSLLHWLSFSFWFKFKINFNFKSFSFDLKFGFNFKFEFGFSSSLSELISFIEFNLAGHLASLSRLAWVMS